MALSSLTFTTPRAQASQIFSPRLSSAVKPTPSSSSSSVSATKKAISNVGIGVLAASVLALSPLDANATRIEYYATVGEPLCEFRYVPSGLGYCDLAVGSGEEVPYNELINVHYTARFADGIVFDSSYKRARPLTMRIGVGKVIRGLDQGILGGEGVPPMLVGGKRKLKIPPHLAYGPEPAGCFSGDCNIPGNATLVYDINFVGVYSGNRK
ncbi:photosynthetic NDH subunit of lumenal location 4, chloroplastic [Cucurbita pepo subsp. pepo]|uniref:photosynthetic NDH subunit of lumenal location 4, chloroplastic n=1 Tax=Cucurbita pepo subsp. pepo TaxID=3664 RepID=UPI000C9D7BA3|nr:photosynthetic NDH subunit of lumenal location 4, chloroplastic [Cucurbita pepo subsp. pepo]